MKNLEYSGFSGLIDGKIPDVEYNYYRDIGEKDLLQFMKNIQW